jgi:hypothetical protein
MSKKLILPAEVKVCATCSFWDGERNIDHELALVVVEEGCMGKCLAEDKNCLGLNDEFEWRDDCLWEHLAPDMPESHVCEHLAPDTRVGHVCEHLTLDTLASNVCEHFVPNALEPDGLANG